MSYANTYHPSHSPMKVARGLLVLSGALLLNSALYAAEKNPPVRSKAAQTVTSANSARLQPRMIGEKPDFAILNVSNRHTSGPKGIIRYGSCKNDIRVVIKNYGKAYTYGDRVSGIRKKSVVGGQILVRLEQVIDGSVKAAHNLYVNQLGKNKVKNIDFISTNPGWFPVRRSYTLRATIIPCTKGSSTPNCNVFQEVKTTNNTLSINLFAGTSC